MGKINVILSLLIMGLTIIAFQCTKKLTVEVEQAEKAVAQAKAAGADELAPKTYQAAVDKLAVAKRLNDAKKIPEAKSAFKEVIALAKTAMAEAKAAKRQAEAEAAAAEKVDAVVRSYTVAPGDYLWKIAGMSRIYGDGNQWNRIYRANQDRIDSNFERYKAYVAENQMQSQFTNPAQLIYAGWELSVPR